MVIVIRGRARRLQGRRAVSGQGVAIEQLRGYDCISELFEEAGVVCAIEARGEKGLNEPNPAQVSYCGVVAEAVKLQGAAEVFNIQSSFSSVTAATMAAPVTARRAPACWQQHCGIEP